MCYLPGLTHGRHVVHLYSVSPFGIMYDNSADASPQLAFTVSCYTLSPSIPTCNRSTCACTCGSNTRTQRQKNKKHANTQANKQARKQTNKQTHKQTNLTNNQSHTHTNDSENKHRLEASYASARQPSTAQILKAVLHNVW